MCPSSSSNPQSPIPNPSANLSERLSDAVRLACRWHVDQRRKVSGAPYVAHLLGVAGIVLDSGGSDDEAVAAILHDAVEDQGGPETRRHIERLFGPAVARIVDECSDTDESPKPPWRQRKEAFIARLPSVSASARLVTAADKLDNVRGLIQGYHEQGEKLWAHFLGGRAGALWYHRAVVDALRRIEPSPLVERLHREVSLLESLVRDGSSEASGG
jgi:(p)ppGpp synthase/HD superfamily hydrolase